MAVKQYLNATHAAIYLGISRQYFYFIKRKYKLEPSHQEGIVSYYSKRELSIIKRWMKK